MNPLALHLQRQSARQQRTALTIRILEAMAPYGERPMLVCLSKNSDGEQEFCLLSLDSRQSLYEYIDRNGAISVALGINGHFVLVCVDDQDLGVQPAPIPKTHYLVCNRFTDFKEWFDGIIQTTGSKRRGIRPDQSHRRTGSRPPFKGKK